MKYLKYFETKLEVEYHCLECGWIGWLPMTKIVKCPNCGNINDIWKEGESIPERHKKMNYLSENINIIKQQPFYLSGDILYISDDMAKLMTPTYAKLNKLYKNKGVRDYINQEQIDFYNNEKDDKGYYKSRNINTNITVRYERMYAMTILIKRLGGVLENKYGEFQYFIGGTSGDHDMHGKNMVRDTKECNYNLMIKYYPIIEHIKNFYKRLKSKDEGFFDIIKDSLDKDIMLAQYGVPKELKKYFKNAEDVAINVNKFNI